METVENLAETSTNYPSSVEREGTPETNVALGVSSNSPCMNAGQAKEDVVSDTAGYDNDDTSLNVAGTTETTDPTDLSLTDKNKSFLYNGESVLTATKSAVLSTGAKRSNSTSSNKLNRTATPSKGGYPFMGYQILPIIPQPVLFPVMSKNHFGYQQSSASQQQPDPLSTTNLYIKGLPENCTDDDLEGMCKHYGKIVSTKAILDKKTGICKGYGFVDFQDPTDASKAVQSLQNNGVLAQFAKLQEQDPTNLYMSNLPKHYTEKHLEQMLSPHGSIISSRILRDLGGVSRGVGFVRLDSHDHCQQAIEKLNGTVLAGHSEPLNIKFADGSTNKKKLQGNWKDVDFMAWKDYGAVQDQYVYDVPPTAVLAPNSYVSSRLLSQNVVSASPYLHQSSQIAGYQVQAGSNTSSSWQNQYYLSPGNLNGSDTVHGLASQVNAIQLSSQTPNGTGGSASGSSSSFPPPHDQQLYSIPHSGNTSANGGHASAPLPPTHSAQYTHQPQGWTIRLSHTPHYIQQHT